MDNTIRKFVYRVRARLREQQIVASLFRFVSYGLVFAIILSLISMFVPFYYAIPMAAAGLILFFFAGILLGIRKTPKPMEAALLADAKGHKEKISTAFFLAGKEDSFSILQKKDAIKIMDGFAIRKEFPLRIPPQKTILIIVLLAVFVVSSLIDTPARETASVRHEVAKEAKEDIARLEKVEKKLEETTDLPPAEVEEIKEQIEKAKRELADADSREELKKAEERINKKLEMASEKIENKTLSEIVREAAKEGEQASDEKEKELAQAAKQALEKAENGSREDKKEAYEKMKELADAAGDEQLKEAAESYRESSYSDGDYAEANRALNRTMDNMEKNKTESKDYAANNNSTGDGNNDNSQDGGNNSKGNDSGTDAGEKGNGTGGGWNQGDKNGSEGERKTGENITVPDGELGDDEDLTGKANSAGNSSTASSDKAQTWSGNKVSYGQVSGEYKEKAYKKVNGSNYPGKLKDRIKNYFNGLN